MCESRWFSFDERIDPFTLRDDPGSLSQCLMSILACEEEALTVPAFTCASLHKERASHRTNLFPVI